MKRALADPEPTSYPSTRGVLTACKTEKPISFTTLDVIQRRSANQGPADRSNERLGSRLMSVEIVDSSERQIEE